MSLVTVMYIDLYENSLQEKFIDEYELEPAETSDRKSESSEVSGICRDVVYATRFGHQDQIEVG